MIVIHDVTSTLHSEKEKAGLIGLCRIGVLLPFQ